MGKHRAVSHSQVPLEGSRESRWAAPSKYTYQEILLGLRCACQHQQHRQSKRGQVIGRHKSAAVLGLAF